jgi:hypothetical protein
MKVWCARGKTTQDRSLNLADVIVCKQLNNFVTSNLLLSVPGEGVLILTQEVFTSSTKFLFRLFERLETGTSRRFYLAEP